MAIDFQQVREQVKQLGEQAPLRERALDALRRRARELLDGQAHAIEALRQKVDLVARSYEPGLRCALPASEPLNTCVSLPGLPNQATLLAADGSQINLDRHAEVEFGLINVGAIQMRHASPEPPRTTVTSRLLYHDDLYTAAGTLSEAALALRRDLVERSLLADLASASPPPVIAISDGPLELWGSKEAGGEATQEYQQTLQGYLRALDRLCQLNVTAAGYVDKPGANLVVRLLEVAQARQEDLEGIKDYHPLRGVTDRDLFLPLLETGERSAVFAIRSQSAKLYPGQLALHFFYLNVGRAGHPWLARVEVPAWVTVSPNMVDGLHAMLVEQCRIMGARPYPYLLHRAHETARVGLQEKDQVTQMIANELLARGLAPAGKSHKQAAKDLGGRTGYRQ